MTLVSVVVPVFNTERFVRDAIQSALGQEHATVEIIAVDDGSTDASRDIVASFGDHVLALAQAHAGIGAARNAGVARATGEFLAFLDADDLWTPARLARALDPFSAPDPPDIVFGMVEQFRDTPGGRLRVGELAKGYLAGAMLVRRATFERVGPFATDIRAGEFIDWYARASELGLRTRLLDDVFLLRRLHDANTARTSGTANQDVPSVLRAALQRRRAAGRDQ
jgi:glycosyltransferase involved in cell wall biosynthesis